MPAHPARPDRSWPRCPCPSSTPPPRASRSTWPTSQTSSPAPATTTSTSTPPTPPRAPCAASWLRRSPDPETRLGFLTPRQILLELHDHRPARSDEHTSELQSLMRISYAVFGLKKQNTTKNT